MLRLYYAPKTRAFRPRWLLEEIGAPYELVPVDLAAREHKTAAHRAIHPHAAVPVLDDGRGTVIFESGAICAHLAETFPEAGLAPSVGSPARPLYLQWMFYSVATLEPPGFRYFLHTMRLPPERRSKNVATEARERFDESAEVLSQALQSGPFLLGESFSAADVMVGSMLALGRDLGLLEGWPRLRSYVETLASRPAYQRAAAD